MAGKYRPPRLTVIRDYEVLVSRAEEMKKKAEELIASGMCPWGPPSFILVNDSIKCCQVFVKKEQVRVTVKEE